MPQLVRQAAFAAMHKVSRKTVTMWKARGWLVMDDDLVDVEQSNARLKKYRSAGIDEAVTAPSAGNDKKVTPPDDDSPESAAERILAARGADWDTDEAKRIKENYTALLLQLKYDRDAGALIELSAAQAVLFEEARKWRDSWMNWTARIAPLVAADLGVPVEKVIEALNPHVHKQIADLGEPDGTFEG